MGFPQIQNKAICQRLCHKKGKEKTRKAKTVALETKVRELESIISTNSNDLVIEEYHKCKTELEEIYNYIILRSDTDWYELGEKSTKDFLNLEKRNKIRLNHTSGKSTMKTMKSQLILMRFLPN